MVTHRHQALQHKYNTIATSVRPTISKIIHSMIVPSAKSRTACSSIRAWIPKTVVCLARDGQASLRYFTR